MAIISTATLDVFQASGTINASDVVGAFDTIYDQLNGGLTADNIAGNFTVDASQITVVDTNLYVSATKASLIGTEMTQKGWNTIHAIGLGTGGFSVFPGVIEINGNYCTLNQRINFHKQTISHNSSTSKLWLLVANSAPVLTASDFALIEWTATDTVSYDVTKDGWYFSQSSRMLYTVRANLGPAFGTANARFYINDAFQRPSIGFRYQLTDTEASQASFFDYSQVTYIFDMDSNRYYYDLTIKPPAAPGATVPFLNGNHILDSTATADQWIGPSGGAQHHFYVEKIDIHLNGEYLYGNGSCYINDSGGAIVARSYYDQFSGELRAYYYTQTTTSASNMTSYRLVFKQRQDSLRFS